MAEYGILRKKSKKRKGKGGPVKLTKNGRKWKDKSET
jgi:hypothetical protein